MKKRREWTHKLEERAYLDPPVCLWHLLSALVLQEVGEVLFTGHLSSSSLHLVRDILLSIFYRQRTEAVRWLYFKLQHSETWQDQGCWLTSEPGFFLPHLVLWEEGLLLDLGWGFVTAVISRGYGMSMSFRVRSQLHLLGVCPLRAFTLITSEMTHLTDLRWRKLGQGEGEDLVQF